MKNRIAVWSLLSENFNSKHSIRHLKFRENCDAYLHFPFQNLVSITDPLREFHTNNRCKQTLLKINNIYSKRKGIDMEKVDHL